MKNVPENYSQDPWKRGQEMTCEPRRTVWSRFLLKVEESKAIFRGCSEWPAWSIMLSEIEGNH